MKTEAEAGPAILGVRGHEDEPGRGGLAGGAAHELVTRVDGAADVGVVGVALHVGVGELVHELEGAGAVVSA
jgi:hypothetical protein